MFLRRAAGADLVGVISIHGRRETGVEAETRRRLDLEFDDVEVPIPGDAMSLYRAISRKRWAEQNGLHEVPPTSSDAARIIDFAEAVRGLDGTLLCHCGGGMSRAPAAALICLTVWTGPGAEVECVQEVAKLRRGAVPHAGLVRFADDLLGRGGNLLSAFTSHRP